MGINKKTIILIILSMIILITISTAITFFTTKTLLLKYINDNNLIQNKENDNTIDIPLNDINPNEDNTTINDNNDTSEDIKTEITTQKNNNATTTQRYITVPNVTGLSTNKAIETLQKEGFKYIVESRSSNTVEEKHVIKTIPNAGSNREKGDTITIIESTGKTYYYLENYIGKNYTEIKAKLELQGINVLIEKMEVEDKEKYKNKENIVIDQKPKYNADSPTIIENGSNITLYIPNITREFPDMITENWTLSDVITFASQYNLNLIVVDNTNNTIPTNTYNNYQNIKIIQQSRPAGDQIIEGTTLKVKINI